MSGAGDLRHRLVHETAVNLPDGAGGESITYLAVDQIWGRIETPAGDPALSAERRMALLVHRITVRAPNTISRGDRLTLGARIFAVEALSDPDGRRRFTRCLCREEQT
ncbi:phage head closure protein [Xanthobacter sp. DSM 24535]|uniref:phage head closure protein n=1 Tax=Roseixanthobacter psychrophilus TaxID=3119917 RepID=UPI00372A5413